MGINNTLRVRFSIGADLKTTSILKRNVNIKLKLCIYKQDVVEGKESKMCVRDESERDKFSIPPLISISFINTYICSIKAS